MLKLLIFSMIYYDIVIWVGSETFQSVAYDNYDDFSTCQLHTFIKNCFNILRIV
jgi:hypothetical protein